uniref:CCHC-type domain-containing protein n=1 Tax=Chenopodium quinoa TaxID=63459 RepID=A0A803MKN4_CHEQI
MGDKNKVLSNPGVEGIALSTLENKDRENSNNNIPKEGVNDAIEWDVDGEDDDDARVELALVGKIWTDRNINSNAFIATMKSVWQPRHGVDITSIDKNLFLFQFYHWRDKNRVLEGQPWHFDKHALILGETADSVKPTNIQLFHLPMWIRVYNLPLKGRLNLSNVEKIGNKLGVFVKLDNDARVGIDKSIRIRVLVDVRKPLAKHVKLKLRGGLEELFEVKYERPPLFCFCCGLMGHGMKDCEVYRETENPVISYGAWMKASPWKSAVGGNEEGAGVDNQKTARALFVTKPKKQAPNPAVSACVQEKAKVLGEVGLNSSRNKGDGADCGAHDERSNNELFVFGSSNLETGNKEVSATLVERRKDGLALLWNNNSDVNIRSYSLHHIDALVRSSLHGVWRFSGVYGHPEDENKYKTGLLLESLKEVNDNPWLCGGDWNLMLYSGEKQGGRAFNVEEADILRAVVSHCQLEDLGFIGHPFTWSNNRGGEENIQERLDRFLANRAWRDFFQGSFVTHLSKRKSDHLPILLCIKEATPSQKKKKKKKRLYRFEEMWLRDENCADIVSEAWDYGGDLCSKIAFTSTRLSAWSREKFGDFVKELNACKAQMKVLTGEVQSTEVVAQMRALDDRMDELERREEMYWKQRSRQDWLKHGDKNTSFFIIKPSREKLGTTLYV